MGLPTAATCRKKCTHCTLRPPTVKDLRTAFINGGRSGVQACATLTA